MRGGTYKRHAISEFRAPARSMCHGRSGDPLKSAPSLVQESGEHLAESLEFVGAILPRKGKTEADQMHS